MNSDEAGALDGPPTTSDFEELVRQQFGNVNPGSADDEFPYAEESRAPSQDPGDGPDRDSQFRYLNEMFTRFFLGTGGLEGLSSAIRRDTDEMRTTLQIALSRAERRHRQERQELRDDMQALLADAAEQFRGALAKVRERQTEERRQLWDEVQRGMAETGEQLRTLAEANGQLQQGRQELRNELEGALVHAHGHLEAVLSAVQVEGQKALRLALEEHANLIGTLPGTFVQSYDRLNSRLTVVLDQLGELRKEFSSISREAGDEISRSLADRVAR